MKLIPLTQGQFAKVDDSDFEWLSQWKWYARWGKTGKTFYAARSVNTGDRIIGIIMHRLILGLEPGDKRLPDHKNLDTLDNQRSNLRLCTQAENCRNQRRQKNNTSGFKGVSYSDHMSQWRARISLNEKTTHLGYFDTPELAHSAYVEAAKQMHGEFANAG